MIGPTTTLQALALAACGAAVVALTRQGSLLAAAAGMVVATASIVGLGPGALPPLALFVLGGGALTKWGGARKRAMAAGEPNEGRRGARHVAAKLAIPALVAAAAGLTGRADAWAAAFAAGLAGALADTAGTEVGPLGGGSAYAIRGGRLARLPHGSPGAVSLAGLAASAAGSAAVAATAVVSGLLQGWTLAGAAASGGIAAALLESAVAETALGRRFGHFGRNVLVSAAATTFGWAAGLSLGGRA
ncbi:MAG TPA: DUF92 domain-containing protein [Candidatus Eisenbacteria bacterium]|nr:DUF92 domain-containing protein [Candidatus Eisenbacteria bacterium]